MHVLLLNPNTRADLTDELVALVAPSFQDTGVAVRGATAPFGADYIASEQTYLIAAHAVLDAWHAHVQQHDRPSLSQTVQRQRGAVLAQPEQRFQVMRRQQGAIAIGHQHVALEVRQRILGGEHGVAHGPRRVRAAPADNAKAVPAVVQRKGPRRNEIRSAMPCGGIADSKPSGISEVAPPSSVAISFRRNVRREPSSSFRVTLPAVSEAMRP